MGSSVVGSSVVGSSVVGSSVVGSSVSRPRTCITYSGVAIFVVPSVRNGQGMSSAV